MLHSTAEATPGGSESKRVVIDGVIFQFEDGGKKLTRIGGGRRLSALMAELAPGSSSSGTPTRQSLKYGGEQYRRTKRGNLVSRSTCVAPLPLTSGCLRNAPSRQKSPADTIPRLVGAAHALLTTNRPVRSRSDVPVSAHSRPARHLPAVPAGIVSAWSRRLPAIAHPVGT